MTGLQTVNGTARRLASAPAYGDPFGVFGRDFDRMIGSIFGRDGLVSSAGASGDEVSQKLLTPRIDVHETYGNIELAAELPGV